MGHHDKLASRCVCPKREARFLEISLSFEPMTTPKLERNMKPDLSQEGQRLSKGENTTVLSSKGLLYRLVAYGWCFACLISSVVLFLRRASSWGT